MHEDDPPALRFVVPGPPVPLARPRVVKGHAFTPKRSRQYKRHVAAMALIALSSSGWTAAKKRWTLDVRYGLRMTFYRSARRGDADNFAKSVCDALQGVLYRNDAQVTNLDLAIDVDRQNPRAEIEVWCWAPIGRLTGAERAG